MARSTPSSEEYNILFSSSNSPRQDRLKTLRRAQLPQDNGSGGQQTLTDKTSCLIPLPSESQNMANEPTKQGQQHAPDTANIFVLQHICQPLRPSARLPVDAQKSDKSSMTNDASQRKVVGSRVAKSSTTTKTAKSKLHSTPAIGGRSGGAVMGVFVNNRLGSKAEILCSPSDTVGDFKKLAALKLGTGAEAIRLKRQGQRALRDAITLEDYEIGNGSSLDYEIDT